MLLVLTVCFSGRTAMAAPPPSAFQNVVSSQQIQISTNVGSGGGESGQDNAGISMAVDANGDVIMGNLYGGAILLFSLTPGATNPTVLGTVSGNPAGVAVDSKNNLYIGNATVATIIKVPYVNGAWVAISSPSSSTPNCTGSDTVECVMSNLNTDNSGVSSLVFDSAGDLFYSTTNIADDGAGTAPNSIWECTAACLYTGSPAATLLYTEPTSATPNTTGQLNVGALAVDSYGDLFFTDSALGVTTSQESFSSNLNELVNTSGVFAKTPTVLYTYTPGSPSNYDAEVGGVAVDASGTVYALASGGPGLIAFPNANGVVNVAKVYTVSTITDKLLAVNSQGNFFVEGYSNALSTDVMNFVPVNSLIATGAASGATSTATFLTVLNDGGCSPAPTVTYAFTGTDASQFSAATTGTCSSTTTGASYSATLTFKPTAVGTSTATLTATDSANSGTAAVTGAGEGPVATPTFSLAGGTYTGSQPVSLADATAGASIYYTTDGTTPGAGTGTSVLYTAPITVGASETINAIGVEAGDTNSAVATAAYTINVAGAAATPTFSVAAGTYTSPQSVAISDTTAGAAIYYTTNGSAPSASSNLYLGPIDVASTETISAIAIGGGFGASGVAKELFTISLPASAFQNVVMSQVTLLGAFTGGGSQSGTVPAGDSMAVNQLGDVIATNTYGGQTVAFSPTGGTPTVLGTISNQNGVAVDSQNNLYVAFSYNDYVIKVPYVNGAYATMSTPKAGTTPNCTGTDTAECLMNNLTTGGADVISMVFDPAGDLFYSTGLSGGTNNAIFECTAACLYTGSPAPTMLFQEPTSTTPGTTGQLDIGGLALDASGDLFFTDSAVSSTTSQESFSSNLNELAYKSGTGYAATPTVIDTYTPTSVAAYGSEIDGVAVSPNGTVYIVIQGGQGAPGIIAFPDVSGVYSSKTNYLAAVTTSKGSITTLNGKSMTSDGLGNLYIADDGGNVYEIAVDSLTAATSPVQNPSTTSFFTILNDGGCTATPPTVTFAATGTSAAAFSAATTGTCQATVTAGSAGAAYATTLTFSPLTVGANTGTLTATDSLKNTGVAAVSGIGTPAPQAATPTLSVAAGTYTTVQSVTIADATTGSSIYYTLDGSTPTTSSTLYTAPVSVGVTETLTAIADGYGYTASAAASAAYVINLPTAATPAFSVPTGTYTTPQKVTITDATTGAAIYYTLDGTPPTASSTAYNGPITVGVTETINAIAVATNYNNSSVGSAVYTINLPVAATPAFSVTAGTYAAVQSVSLSDATAGAKIYYTTDGSTPTAGTGTSALYSTPILVPASMTIKAIAVDPPNYNNSVIATAAIVINLPAPAFTIASSATTLIAPAGGTTTTTLTIAANAAFNGTIGFSCAGFVPVGATCAFNPTNVTLLAQASGTTVLTVSVPATTASLRHGPSPLSSGSMVAAALCFLGLRKRRRLQMMLLFMVSAVGLSMFTGCTTTSTSTTSSSQFVVNAAAASCPVTHLTCATVTGPGIPTAVQVTESLPLVLTVQ
jgi:hypothetical protein